MFGNQMIESMESRRLMAVDSFLGDTDIVVQETTSIGLLLPAVNTQAGAHGTGGGAGKVSMQDFHFTVKYDKASPVLAK